MKMNDGGQAFPSTAYYDEKPYGTTDGMTLRDYFAAHAPRKPQLWFRPVFPPQPDRTYDHDHPNLEACQYADCPYTNYDERRTWRADFDEATQIQWPYAWADAMLKARDPQQSSDTVEDQWIRIAAENAKDANDRLAAMKAERDRLRAALVGILSVDGRAELEQMEVVIRSMPAPAQDKAASIDAVHALLATLPTEITTGGTVNDHRTDAEKQADGGW